MDKVIVHFKNPVWGGGAGTDRAKLPERIFSREAHGDNFKEIAKEFSVTNVRNVAHIEGLDEKEMKEVATERKRKSAK